MIDREPHEIVLDIVLRYSPSMPKMGEATVLKGNMIFLTRNHRRQALTLSVPVNFDGDPVEGSDPRFVLYRIDARVWKLSPSFLHPLLHCYITVVGVPEDINW